MGAITNVFRRGAVYYFRKRFRWPDGAHSAICLSLQTRRLAEAKLRASGLAVTCEQLQVELARMDPIQPEPLSLADGAEIRARQLLLEVIALRALHDRSSY